MEQKRASQQGEVLRKHSQLQAQQSCHRGPIDTTPTGTCLGHPPSSPWYPPTWYLPLGPKRSPSFSQVTMGLGFPNAMQVKVTLLPSFASTYCGGVSVKVGGAAGQRETSVSPAFHPWVWGDTGTEGRLLPANRGDTAHPHSSPGTTNGAAGMARTATVTVAVPGDTHRGHPLHSTLPPHPASSPPRQLQGMAPLPHPPSCTLTRYCQNRGKHRSADRKAPS